MTSLHKYLINFINNDNLILEFFRVDWEMIGRDRWILIVPWYRHWLFGSYKYKVEIEIDKLNVSVIHQKEVKGFWPKSIVIKAPYPLKGKVIFYRKDI